VREGRSLAERGAENPLDIICGSGRQRDLANYPGMRGSRDPVYRLQGVKIKDKLIEVCLRKMLRKIEGMDAGVGLLRGEHDGSRGCLVSCENSRPRGSTVGNGGTHVAGADYQRTGTESFISAA